MQKTHSGNSKLFSYYLKQNAQHNHHNYGQGIGDMTRINRVYKSIKSNRSGNIVMQEVEYDVAIDVESCI